MMSKNQFIAKLCESSMSDFQPRYFKPLKLVLSMNKYIFSLSQILSGAAMLISSSWLTLLNGCSFIALANKAGKLFHLAGHHA